MNEEERHARQRNLPHAIEMRKKPTATEATIWYYLRGHNLAGYKFRQQQPLDGYIVDFYSAACQLIIEIDGDTHADQPEYDAQRTAKLESRGYKVIRFTNDEVRHQINAVLEVILNECQTRHSIAQHNNPPEQP